jgi:hypothetical protein
MSELGFETEDTYGYAPCSLFLLLFQHLLFLLYLLLLLPLPLLASCWGRASQSGFGGSGSSLGGGGASFGGDGAGIGGGEGVKIFFALEAQPRNGGFWMFCLKITC